ncbi:hypothetical protein BLNAU_24868 [Blattamonas nauphoetae]|uniref:Uncharacterized protein n=1 Tax=Blattamonas nauphoetae TaxID=2049346 RepID=A0ABQ9WM27_9EUKA|nr:hypothetical protein BLNAU_24868 [Blattamonas nauphoetae]
MAQHIKPTSVTDLLLDRVISLLINPMTTSSSLPRTRLSNTPNALALTQLQYSSRLPPRPPNTIRRPQRTILSPNSSHGDSPTTLHHPSKRLPSHVLDQSEQKEEAEKKIAKQAEPRKFKQITSSSLHSPHTFRRKEKNSKREEANVHAGQVSENKEDNKEDNGNDIIRKIKRRQSEPPEVVNNLKPVESKRDRKKDEEDHTSESPSPTFSYLMSLCQNKESLTPPPSPNSTGTDSTPKNDEKISIDLPSPPAISGPQNEGMISERTLKVSIKAQMRVRERGIAKLRERHLTRLGQPQTSRRGLQKSKRVSKPHQNNKTKKKPGRKPEKKTIPADTTPHDKLHVPNDSQILFTSNNQINQNISFFYPTHPLDYTQTRQQSSPPIDIDSTASFLPKPQPSRDIMQDNEMINSVGEWFALHPMETHPTGKWTSHDDHSRNLNQVTREVDEIYSKSFPHFPHLSHWLPIETLFTISSQTTKKELPPDFFNLMSKRIKDLTDAQWDTLRRHSVCIQPSPIIDHQKIIGQIERNIRDDPSSVMDLPSHIFDHFRRSLHAPKRKRQSKKTIDINFGIDTAISRFPRSQPAGADTTMLEIHNPANSSSPPIDINFGTDTAISPFPRSQPAGADTTMLEIHNPANSSSPPIDINFGTDTAISPFPRSQPAGADTTMLEIHNSANSSSPPIDINFGTDTAISPFPRSQPAGADTTMLEIHNPANPSSPPVDINFGTDTAISPFPRSQPAGADTTMLEIHNPANSSSPPIDINFGTDTAISPFPRSQPAGADTTMLEIHNPANSSSPPIDINFGTDTAISPFPRSQPAGADTTMLEIHNPANSSSPPIDINFGTDTAISPFPRLQPAGADTTMLEIHIPANSSSPSTFAAEISRPRPILAAYSPPMPISKTKTGMASMHLPIKRNSSLLTSAEARDTRNTARQELVGEQSINDRDRERLAVAKGNQLGLTEKCRLLVRRMNQFDCIHLNTIRNDLTLGTDELRPRRAERWSAQKMNQFNILTTTPIEMLFPVVGLGTTLPLDNQTLKKSIIQLSEDEASHIENLLTKTVMKKFSVVNAWKSLAGPEAIGLKRDNPSNLARQKRAEYSEARERFDITNTFNMPAKHHHPISFQRANTPPLEEIQTLISLPFDPFDGYTRWDADLSTRHLRKAKDALKQTFSDLLTTLSAPNPDLMEREELVSTKELTQLENQTEPPLETILQQIQALHNFEDEKTLQLSPSHHTNKPDKGGEATEIKNALNSLNTNSTPSLDGLTVELIKRCNGDSSQKPGAYAAYAPFKSQMVPTDQ